MEVVEEPFPGGADVQIPVDGVGEAGVRVVEDATCLVEPGEQGRVAAFLSRASQALGGGDRAGAIAEMLGAEQVTADRAGEQLLASITVALEEPGEESERRCGLDVNAPDVDFAGLCQSER